MEWQRLLSNKRLGMEDIHDERRDDRSLFLRDYDRLIFSSPFRRLQNKTQVFPLPGSIFVHNRLTHSLEVSCVGRSLGNNVAKAMVGKRTLSSDNFLQEVGNIVAAACLAHDLGNPPFGHSGEKAIAAYFTDGEGAILQERLTAAQWADIIHFDGNANAFRLLTHQFPGRRKGGFAMTYSTLASIVKYPYSSVYATKEKSKFGFFESESATYEKIAHELGIIKLSKPGEPIKYARYPLVYLVEAADDICYLIMDLEDAHKLKFVTTEETVSMMMAFLSDTQQERVRSIMSMVTDINEQISYIRSKLIGILIDECSKVFTTYENEILEGKFQGSLIDHISERPKKAYKECAKVSSEKIYRSKEVLDIEIAGFKIITTLLDLMTKSILHPSTEYSKLLLRRVSSQYEVNASDCYTKLIAVLDYISGMTDVFALDLYRKINGNSLPAV